MTYATVPAGTAGRDEGPGTAPSQAVPGPSRPWASWRSHSQYPAGPDNCGRLVDVHPRSAGDLEDARPRVEELGADIREGSAP
jgi:hypothetical protein